MAAVVLQNVHKIYPGDIVAVEDANLAVEDREFVVLVGPSGCGKSTTLRMVAGLEEISKGSISIDGRVVNDVPPKDRDIAMVFQNYALYPHMTVYKNMAFGLKLRRYPKAEIEKRVKEAAEILGIEELLGRRPKELSGGQRQRVAVGRAIVRKPKVFLFDEPLSNLDAKMRVQMRAELSKLHTRLSSTMIYVTHDQMEAMTMGDRIVVMRGGRIQQVAPPLELYNRPINRFVAGFIGSPPMNFFGGCIKQREDGIYFDEGRFSLRIDDKHGAGLAGHLERDVSMGVRPEDIVAAASVPAAAPERAVQARVEVVEPVGAEVYIYLNSGAHTFVSRAENIGNARVEQDLEVVFNMANAHYFDRSSGARLL
jgi:multiple sugar transport system ATP-binding protein